MFEDEARFGRRSDPIRCWAPLGCRPQVSTHRVRQYTHVFGSVCPHDGELISLILPHADTDAMSLYLAEVSRRHPDEHVLMFLDRAGWHQAEALVVPDNLTLDWLPAYSPQCNPQELVWREVRRHPVGNHDYDSMDAVANALEHRLRQLESSPALIQSLTGFDWIVNVRLNQNSISGGHSVVRLKCVVVTGNGFVLPPQLFERVAFLTSARRVSAAVSTPRQNVPVPSPVCLRPRRHSVLSVNGS